MSKLVWYSILSYGYTSTLTDLDTEITISTSINKNSTDLKVADKACHRECESSVWISTSVVWVERRGSLSLNKCK